MKIFMIALISVAILFGVFRVKVGYEQQQFLNDSAAGKIVSQYNKDQFTGTWYSDEAEMDITIGSDGRWSAKGAFGRWALDGDDFVWVYDRMYLSNNIFIGKLDKNRILFVDPNKFVLKEISGSETTFTRTRK